MLKSKIGGVIVSINTVQFSSVFTLSTVHVTRGIHETNLNNKKGIKHQSISFNLPMITPGVLLYIE